MTTISLDKAVKNILLKRGYSLHWYLNFLVPMKDILRELSFDDGIGTIRYVCLPLNSNNAVTLPDDYVDYARVSYRANQYLIPLVEETGLDIVPNYDSSFDIHPYNTGIASQTSTATNSQLYNGYLSPYWWMVNWNAFGENLGRQFGGVGNKADTFRVNKQRNEIKINESLAVDEIVLEYIGNGLDADSATHIDAYAQATLEAYAIWQFKKNNRTYSAGEAAAEEQNYINERRILRARMSDLTTDRLKRIVQSNAIAIKY